MSARLRAMEKRCRKNGGDCPCGDECRAEAESLRHSIFSAEIPCETRGDVVEYVTLDVVDCGDVPVRIVDDEEFFQ